MEILGLILPLSISFVTFENVLAHLRTVSRSGHSQALSMCAWPIAETLCAEAVAGIAPARAATAVAASASFISESGSAGRSRPAR